MSDQNAVSDENLLHRIQKLVDHEHELLNDPSIDDAGRAKLGRMQVELDQCWDLLRQRRALREAGDDPARAHVRPPEIVENYEQ